MKLLLKYCLILFAGCNIGVVNAQYSARIYGKITDTLGLPLDLANVVVEGMPKIGTSTNESGRYELIIPHNQPVTIEISSVGYLPVKKTVTVEAGKRLQVSVSLVPTTLSLPDVTVGERSHSTDGLERINPKHIQNIPGMSSGVEALIKSSGLGVFSQNDLSSQYNVRGGNYDENLIYLNGIEIYRPFLIRSGQQEGLSFINPDLVSAIKFSSGGFDACYGDKMSSVLDVRYKTPYSFGGSVSGSLVGASMHLEGITKNKKLSALLGARYHAGTYMFNQLQQKGDYKPNFADVQFLLNYQPSDKVEITFFGNYARNIYRLIPTNQTTVIGTIGEAIGFEVGFEGQEIDAYQTIFSALTTKFNLNKNNNLKLLLAYFNSTEKETFDIKADYWMGKVNSSYGSDDYGQIISPRAIGADYHHARNFLNSNIFNAQFQGEHLIKKNTLTWGITAQGELIADKLNEWRLYDSTGYSLPYVPTIPGDSVPLDSPARWITMGEDYLLTENTTNTLRLSAFIQDKWEFGNENHKFFLVGGVRMAYWTLNNEVIVSPRLRLAYLPQKANLKNLSFYISTGLYCQPAFYKEARRPDGTLNYNIKAQKSYHLIVGADYLFSIARRPFKFSSEIYYKNLQNLITYTLENVRVIYSGENNSKGYAVGIDAKLSGEIVHNLESWLTFSLMQSKEKIDGADTFSFRPTDQRFSINLFFQDRVPKLPMLKAHVNLLYMTALPFCPPNSTTYSLRGKPYFRADIGFSWQFIDGTTRLAKKNPFKFLQAAFLTLEINNLFDYDNTLGYTWINDWQKTYYAIPNYLTPRIFNVKLRFEF
ncbi:MAG: TonB-dependent receptor [Bacteroidales bacterium]|jgi:hypothetical protein|nr:TonB-dependent receptor [Bacteroidales bacterium]